MCFFKDVIEQMCCLFTHLFDQRPGDFILGPGWIVFDELIDRIFPFRKFVFEYIEDDDRIGRCAASAVFEGV